MKIYFYPANASKPDTKKLLHGLQKKCLPVDKPYFPKDGNWWVGYDGDMPVAFCLVAPSLRWADAIYLARAGVVPSHQGLGLQLRMIRIRERWAKRQGRFKWSITDTSDNPASANSLINAGYKLFEPTSPWGLSTSLYWRKRL